MRNAFASAITQLASLDQRVVLLAGDIGNKLFDDFKDRFPSRFYNCGVAEQNMLGVAAGLAHTGMRPFVYTIAPFVAYRPYEQVRTDICYPDLPVVITAVGAGLSYAELGPSHHSCEDIAVMRALPNLQIICPGDSAEVSAAVQALLNSDHPSYLRLGKKGEPQVHARFPRDFRVGQALVIRPGCDIGLISTGNTLPVALEAADELSAMGVDAEVVSMHTVKPLDYRYLAAASRRFPALISMEEHSLIGGLGSAIAEWLIDTNSRDVRLVRFGTPDEFSRHSVTQESARNEAGLSSPHVIRTVLDLLGRKTR